MFKSILLSLIFALLACGLISEKGGHALLLKLEKELMNYNMKAKQEQMSLETEKKEFVASNSNGSNPHHPVLSKEAQEYLDKQISKSKELEQKCNTIIKKTSETIKEMDDLYNKALKLETDAKYIKAEFDRARSGTYNVKWRQDIAKVDTLSQQAQNNISPAKKWTEDSTRIYQSLKDSIETTMNILKYAYQLEKEIKAGLIPESWTSRIIEKNKESNEIINKYEETIKGYTAQQSIKNANYYVKELEKDVQEALNIIRI